MQYTQRIFELENIFHNSQKNHKNLWNNLLRFYCFFVFFVFLCKIPLYCTLTGFCSKDAFSLTDTLTRLTSSLWMCIAPLFNSVICKHNNVCITCITQNWYKYPFSEEIEGRGSSIWRYSIHGRIIVRWKKYTDRSNRVFYV